MRRAARAVLMTMLALTSIGVLATVLPSGSAHAAYCDPGRGWCNDDENRAYSSCSGNGAEAAMWFNATDGGSATDDPGGYYASGVTISATTTNVTVYLHGSGHPCGSILYSQVWGVYVQSSTRCTIGGNSWAACPDSWRLSIPGLPSLYRGTYDGNGWHWSSQGSSLAANLDVGGLLPYGGSATLTIGIYRCYSTSSGGVPGGYRDINYGMDNSGGQCNATPVPVTITRNVDFTLAPVISVNPIVAESGNQVTVTRSVTDTGTRSDPAQWEERTITLPPGSPNPTGGIDGLNPTQHYPGSTYVAGGSGVIFNTGSNPLGTDNPTLPPLPVGSKVCYMLSVQPYRINNGSVDDRWNHGTPVCIIISKKPKLQISGGDVMVGRSNPAPSPSASIAVNRSSISGQTYGSWAEYGAFAPGTSNIASGGALATTTTRTSGTPTNGQSLTFANNNGAIGCGGSDGCFTAAGGMGTRTDLLSQFATIPAGYIPLDTTNAVIIPGLNRITLKNNPSFRPGKYYYNYTGPSPLTIDGTMPMGVSLIVHSTASIVIRGDITNAPGPYTDIAQLPQLMLLTTGNIQINNTVTNVDAWLYTSDTGKISTCDAPIAAPGSYTAGLGAGALYPCDDKHLTINGPVSTGHLQLRRTYGADPVSGGLAGTAEALNLRPDTSLWVQGQSIGTGTVTTVYTQDLPPRF